ncbi:hypothetical protein KP509_1Z202400 [Ceratopteris richardii]|nr:hypothetical protein KP509_1Z202400 [Ceratopteris richardii]
MAPGLALVLELLSKRGSSIEVSNITALHFSALAAATSAVSIVGIFPLYISSSSTGNDVAYIAHSEAFHNAGTDLQTSADEDYKNSRTFSTEELQGTYANKSYDFTLKPIYSAFYLRPFSLTVLRALVVNFQSVLEAYVSRLHDAEEEDELSEEEPLPINFEAALKGTGWSVSREVAVVTIRRVLERLVVPRVSRRLAWKLLKDVPTSAQRKSGRFLPLSEYFLAVTRTTFRGQLLGIAATWLVNLLVDIYSYLSGLHRRLTKMQVGDGCDVDYEVEKEELAFLLRKTVGNTLKCGAALTISSVGAGVGVLVLHPSWGQRIGSIAGEYAGVVGMSYLIDGWIRYGSAGHPELD